MYITDINKAFRINIPPIEAIGLLCIFLFLSGMSKIFNFLANFENVKNIIKFTKINIEKKNI
jgi:hypothetical protein